MQEIMSRPNKIKNFTRKKGPSTPTMQAQVQKFLEECQRLGKIQKARQKAQNSHKEEQK